MRRVSQKTPERQPSALLCCYSSASYRYSTMYPYMVTETSTKQNAAHVSTLTQNILGFSCHVPG